MLDAAGERRRDIRKRVRHDLRNVAAVIAGRAELLLSGAAGPLNDRQRRSLEILAQNADRLAQELDALAALLDADVTPDGDTP